MPTPKNVAIFRFVNQRRKQYPEITWKKLHSQWLEQGGEARGDERNFYRDYKAAKDSLFPPPPS